MAGDILVRSRESGVCLLLALSRLVRQTAVARPHYEGLLPLRTEQQRRPWAERGRTTFLNWVLAVSSPALLEGLQHNCKNY